MPYSYFFRFFVFLRVFIGSAKLTFRDCKLPKFLTYGINTREVYQLWSLPIKSFRWLWQSTFFWWSNLHFLNEIGWRFIYFYQELEFQKSFCLTCVLWIAIFLQSHTRIVEFWVAYYSGIRRRCAQSSKWAFQQPKFTNLREWC